MAKIIADIMEQVEHELSKRSEVMFAYIHGSTLSSGNHRDIDIAVFLFPDVYSKLTSNGEVSIGFAIPLEMELEKRISKKVDVQVLNRAPLRFRYRVITHGALIIDRNSNSRCDFEYLSRVEYFDFRPRRKEYLQEVMT